MDKTATVMTTDAMVVEGPKCECGGRLVWVQKHTLRQCLRCLKVVEEDADVR